jgi:hypothetical protein
VDCDAEEVIEEPLPVLEPPFVVAEPVCLAVPEEPVFEFEFVVVASPVFVAEGLCVCVAGSELAYHSQYVERRKFDEAFGVGNILTAIAIRIIVLPYD